MKFYLFILLSLILLVFSVGAFAEEPIIDRSQWGGPEWQKFAQEYEEEEPPFSLIGGEVPPMADWPVSIWIGNCSATVTGEQVVASAAHCMRNGGSIGFSLGPNRYQAVCTHHPSYRNNSTADWALCKVSTVVLGGDYERINTDPTILAIGKEITNTGYGCTKWGSGIDGRFRIGEAPIVSLPSGNNYDIVTRGSVALCSGDSGGKCTDKRDKASRVVLGVNSRSNTTTTSYMPSWAVPTAQDWAKSWASQNGVKICGIHADAKGCRRSCDNEPDAYVGEGGLFLVGSAIHIGRASDKQQCAWSPREGLSNPDVCDPYAFPATKTTYKLTATTDCGSASAEVTVTPIGILEATK